MGLNSQIRVTRKELTRLQSGYQTATEWIAGHVRRHSEVFGKSKPEMLDATTKSLRSDANKLYEAIGKKTQKFHSLLQRRGDQRARKRVGC